MLTLVAARATALIWLRFQETVESAHTAEAPRPQLDPSLSESVIS
jgi:hypothetical protein